MNDKLKNYKYIIYECKTDKEVKLVQDIVFNNGYNWRGTIEGYNGPQCGDFKTHQILLEKFVEINKEYVDYE